MPYPSSAIYPGAGLFPGSSSEGSEVGITVADIRSWSNVPFEEQGYPVPDSGPDRLQKLVDRALEYVLQVTGYTDAAQIPAALTNTYEEAVQRRTEQLVYKSSEDEAETAGDFELIKSFGAGSYNETRRDMGEMEKAKVINAWPHLNDLLWRMATADRRDEWEEWWADGVVPAFAVTEVEWDGYPGDFYGSHGWIDGIWEG